jgi:hypothetical protein
MGLSSRNDQATHCPLEGSARGESKKRMRTQRLLRALAGWVCIVAAATGLAQPARAGDFRPNRILLVIGDQWDDPSSYLVREGNEFHGVVTLLKSWGIPFDIARLDQQRLDRNILLDHQGQTRYGAILWDADPAQFKDQNYAFLEEAVRKWNVGLVALSNRIAQPTLESLLGVHCRGYYSFSGPIEVTEPQHYLVGGLPSPLDTNDDPRAELSQKGTRNAKVPWGFPPFKKRVLAEGRGARVLATQGGVPQVTVQEVAPGLNAIWIGGDHLQFLHYQALRTLLRRSLALAVGYQVYKDWSRRVILEMDDPGSAQNTWLEHWHYPTLSQEQIERRLIEPLEKNHALVVVNVCPGFVDPLSNKSLWMSSGPDRITFPPSGAWTRG